MKIIDAILFERECTFRTSRSGGKGGQHVNKVETKVELLFDIAASALFSEEEKEMLYAKLQPFLTQGTLLQMVCEKERSQHRNRQLVIEKAILWLTKALKPVKPRTKTKPTKISVEKRLQEKQVHARKKVDRKKPPFIASLFSF